MSAYLKCDFVAFPVHVRHLGVTITLGTLARHSPLRCVQVGGEWGGGVERVSMGVGKWVDEQVLVSGWEWVWG